MTTKAKPTYLVLWAGLLVGALLALAWIGVVQAIADTPRAIAQGPVPARVDFDDLPAEALDGTLPSSEEPGNSLAPTSYNPGAGKMYWTNAFTHRIQRSNLDGSDVESLVIGKIAPMGIALDLIGGKMYWADSVFGNIQRANLDGSEVEDLVTGLHFPQGIALDMAGGKMYWTDDGNHKIQRANLDGSGLEELVTGLQIPRGIALDMAGGKMYWTDYYDDKIQRASLDGSNVEDLITTGLSGPDGIALDVSGGKMYWADFFSGSIQRANLDGSGVKDLVTGLSGPLGIALDVAGGKMYWTDLYTNKIQRANLDGSGVEDLATGLQEPQSIALDAAGGKMYWTDYVAQKIQRANLDGSGTEDLVTIKTDSPFGITLDVAGNKMYWTEFKFGGISIHRANLDGSSVEDLVTGLSAPTDITLDVTGGKMYWVDAGTNKIQRANLDGSSVEDLVTGLTDPIGIDLDVAGGKMYWTDSGTDKIQRANLDGSVVEDLVTTELWYPVGITLDVARGKMYWTDSGTDKIQRANLDGSNIENLVGVFEPSSIALDLTAGKIYWTDWGNHKIHRANLDGSNVEDLITFGRALAGIAIFPAPLSLNGPSTSRINIPQTFTATLTSINATPPFTYVWQADEQSIVTHTSGLSDTLAYTWFSTGAKGITVTADTGSEVFTATRTIDIDVGFTYLPAVMNKFCPLLFSDDFSNPASGWDEVNTNDILLEYLNNEYRIFLKNPDWGVIVTPDFSADNYTLSVDVRSASSTDGTHGLAFGMANDYSGFYTFEVDRFGNYDIWRYRDVDDWILLASGSSGTINQGSASNRLSVERNGASIKAYANGQLLTSLSDSTLLGKRYVGLSATSYDYPFEDARFDNFTVYGVGVGCLEAAVNAVPNTLGAAFSLPALEAISPGNFEGFFEVGRGKGR